MDKKKVAQLDDLVVADILSMSQVELRELVGDADVKAAQADLRKARTLLGKAEMAQASAELAAYREERKVVQLPGAQAATQLQSLRRRDKELDRKLTMAARNAGSDASADAAGIEEDLAELDAWKAEDDKKP